LAALSIYHRLLDLFYEYKVSPEVCYSIVKCNFLHGPAAFLEFPHIMIVFWRFLEVQQNEYDVEGGDGEAQEL